MTRQEIEQKVRTFLIDEFEIDADKVKPEATLKDDLGIDSLDLVDIVVMVQKNFGFKPAVAELKEVKSLSEFCDYIERRMGQHATQTVKQ